MNEELASIEVERRDGRLIVHIRGELDLSNSQSVQVQIEQAVAGSTDVVLDLSAVDYVDSQGLRLFTQLSTRLAREGSKLRLVAPPDGFPRGVLELTRITEDIEVRDTIGDLSD